MQANIKQPPKRHPITAREYFRMGEHGILDADARVELLEGEIIDRPPIGPPHASSTTRLVRLFSECLRDRAIVYSQNPILLGDLSAPEPDVALLKYRDDFYASGHPKPDDVLLVIEVADTSLAHDRQRKLPLYARFGIPEAWLVDIIHRRIEIHRDPDDGRYCTQFRLRPPALISPLLLPDVTLDLSPFL